MLKLKLQFCAHLMRRADSLEKTLTLMIRKIEGRRRRDNRGPDGWMALPTQWMSEQALGADDRQGKPGVLQSPGSQRVVYD